MSARGAAPFVSVIVPVFEDPRLGLCLRALARQTYPADGFEVLVVENGDGPLDGIERLPHRPQRLTVHHEPRPGSYAARNRGIRESAGEILAFTDADCIPEPRWLEAGVAALRSEPPADMLGGEVELIPGDRNRPTAAETWECTWGFPQQEFVESKHFAATANLFVERATFAEVGPFDDRLLSSGDVEWGQRAHAAGKRWAFSREPLVRHPARRRIAELARKYQRTCGGSHELRRIRGESHVPAVTRLLRKPFRSARRRDVGSSARQRVQFAGVETVLSAVQLLELARLTLGGRPRRR